jgi:ubiquinone/menaquinone biosynthesis C-methylase UbiE
MEALKTRLKAMWMSGNFAEVAKHIETGAEEFIARLSLQPGQRVLDVACGSGNLAIPAARAGAIVTGVDIAPNLVEQARARAARGLTIQFDEAMQRICLYEDGSFGVVVGMFGACLRPDRGGCGRAARVCRSGGRIAMVDPRGFVGQMFKTTGKHVPPPPNMPSPLKVTEATVRERLRRHRRSGDQAHVSI